MNYFFVFLLQFLLPISLLIAMNWSRFALHNHYKSIIKISLFQFAVGVALQLYLPTTQTVQLGINIFQLCCFIFFFLCLFSSRFKLAYATQGLLLVTAGMLWAKDPAIASITSTGVINTDFILHSSAIVFGYLFCGFVAALLYFLIRQSRKTFPKPTALLRPIWLILLLVLIIPLIGNALLGLMKLQVLELTKFRLSFVAKSGMINTYLNYITAGILALCLIIFAVRVHSRRKKQQNETQDAIAFRQKKALTQASKRTLIWGFLSVILIVGSQLYWDKVASRPPQLSESQPVTLNANQEIHIPINQVNDGKLHRFVWIADDGKAVRFFIINRLPNRLSLGVVFDACLLCGDMGYAMEGNQVVCVGCGVHLFIPSIGKPGGCNPVPISDWQQTETDVVIKRKSLEEGLNLFSTIVEIDVVDPVNGAKMKNTKAEYKYNYEGRTYFFSSEQNLDSFRDHPEKYVKGEQ